MAKKSKKMQDALKKVDSSKTILGANNNQSTEYKTDAPELGGDKQEKTDGEDGTNSNEIASVNSILSGHGSERDR